jgi:DHA1 family bicyclomycin/chloramphenicol resistance-like MFS transporter
VPSRNPDALRPATLVATWAAIVRHPTFITYSALSTASYAGLFMFLSSSSFIYIRVLGFTRTQYGLTMFAVAAVYIAGTFWCRRLLPRFGVRRTVTIAGGVTLLAGTAMGVLSLAGVQSGWAITPLFALFMFAHGVHQPCGQSGAVGPFPQAAGAASALNGFVMMVTAFAIGGWVGTHLDGTVHALTYGVWFWSVVIAAIAWTLVQKHGEPRRT